MRLFKCLLLILFILSGIYPLSASAQRASEKNSIELIHKDLIPDKITLIVDKTEYALSQADILSWIQEDKTDLTFNITYQSEVENTNFCLYKKSLPCRLIFPYANEEHIKKTSLRDINSAVIENFIKDLARKTNKDPENAKLKMEGGIVYAFSLSSPGLRLNEEKSLELLTDYLAGKINSSVIELPFNYIQPEISTDSIDNLGITSLVGEGRSDFKGSPKNRIFNINVATSRYDGILIKPGEEFSFVKALGEVDAEHGYLPELVIKHDKTEPEFGGGICQVSTTAFRAAINSGLEITARKNHAYPVQYYNPQGMDATVYIPRPDLRFINNTPGYILIETKIENTELIFSFYGTSDGRKTNIIGPKILERNPDGSIKTTLTQQVFDKNGNLIREDVFNSSYDSPSKYPHPGAEEILTKKPKDWSNNEWRSYKKAHGI